MPNKLKKVQFEIKQFTEDDEYFRFEGYASVFGNIDSDEEIMDKSAFDDTIAAVATGKKKIKVLFVHDLAQPVGVIDELRTDDYGLFVKGRMPKNDTLVAGRVIPQMKTGAVDSMSVGFRYGERPLAEEIDGQQAWRIMKADLHEVSLVPLAANDQALVTRFKGATTFRDLPLANRDRNWDSSAANGRVRSFTDSDEKPGTNYRRAFFWFDSSTPEEFGSYKLPFADVIDGRLYAVPRGIFAAAAAMRGARGGVDIPEADRPAVINHIECYYAKLGMDSPWDSSKKLSIDDLKYMTDRDIEEELRQVFSRSAAKAISQGVKGLWDAGEKTDQREADGLAAEKAESYIDRINKALGI